MYIHTVCIYIYIDVHRHVYFRPEMLRCNDYQSQKLHFWEDRMNTADSEEIGPNFEEPANHLANHFDFSTKELSRNKRFNSQKYPNDKNISSLY